MNQPTHETITVVGRGRISHAIPQRVKTAIGNAIVAFAAMEAAAEALIWDFVGLSSDNGRLLTRMDARPKLELAKALSEKHRVLPHPHPQTTKDFWIMVRRLTDAQNRIAHGIWVVLDKKLPVAASYRLTADPGRVLGEAFPLDRLAEIASACGKSKKVFEEMAERHHSSQPKPQPPRHRPKPIQPRSPKPKQK
jgi:hypothetical protein